MVDWQEVGHISIGVITSAYRPSDFPNSLSLLKPNLIVPPLTYYAIDIQIRVRTISPNKKNSNPKKFSGYKGAT